jgi:hypothetical protein
MNSDSGSTPFAGSSPDFLHFGEKCTDRSPWMMNPYLKLFYFCLAEYFHSGQNSR